MSIPLSEMDGGNSAQFNELGDKHTGRILSAVKRQQTDLNTGQPKTWANGDPVMMVVITLQPAEGGDPVQLYARGGKYTAATGSGESMWNAVSAAVRAAGRDTLEPDGQLAVAFTGLGESSKVGYNAPKLYTAQYQPPKPEAIPVDLFSE